MNCLCGRDHVAIGVRRRHMGGVWRLATRRVHYDSRLSHVDLPSTFVGIFSRRQHPDRDIHEGWITGILLAVFKP